MINENQKAPDEKEVVIQNNRVKFFESVNYKKGLTLYSVNKITGELSIVPLDKTELELTGGQTNIIKRRVNMNPNCLYLCALNVDNLIKKLTKAGYNIDPETLKTWQQ